MPVPFSKLPGRIFPTLGSSLHYPWDGCLAGGIVLLLAIGIYSRHWGLHLQVSLAFWSCSSDVVFDRERCLRCTDSKAVLNIDSVNILEDEKLRFRGRRL